MRRELAGSMAFDTSTLLELVFSTPLGLKLKEALLAEKIIGHTSEYNVFELEYVLCRRLGWARAKKVGKKGKTKKLNSFSHFSPISADS